MSTITGFGKALWASAAKTVSPKRAANLGAVTPDHVDVLIVGAGLSGVGAAYHLQESCPDLSYSILEARDSMGGTWDLFRYPGVRSDSDMFTLGYTFRPWPSNKAISPGDMICDYIRDTAREFGIDRKVRFGHKVVAAAWDSATALWTVTVERRTGLNTETLQVTCRFIYTCSGYYNYNEGYAPKWEGMSEFQGQLIYPQFWPENLDYTGKRVVVIGSGATAVTLVPSMAGTAAHVTMLQRSPTYIMSRPTHDLLARPLRRFLPSGLAHRILRAENVGLTTLSYVISRRAPKTVARALTTFAHIQSGKKTDRANFEPRYKPWDQRLCLVPDSDLFTAIRKGNASIVTDEIERFTPTGLQLKSGKTLDADIVISATGLQVQLFGGATITVDGKPINFGDTLWYKGMMFSGVPNLVNSFGYTNASWTLKAELIANYTCRLLNHMSKKGFDTCVAEVKRETDHQAAVDLSSGYIQRAVAIMPQQGTKAPWKVNQNYIRDVRLFKRGKLNDGAMKFERRRSVSVSVAQTLAEGVNS
jgi:monooxygenase